MTQWKPTARTVFCAALCCCVSLLFASPSYAVACTAPRQCDHTTCCVQPIVSRHRSRQGLTTTIALLALLALHRFCQSRTWSPPRAHTMSRTMQMNSMINLALLCLLVLPSAQSLSAAPTKSPTSPPSHSPTQYSDRMLCCSTHIDEELTGDILPWYPPSHEAASTTDDLRFAWFGCPDGYELQGSLQAYCPVLTERDPKCSDATPPTWTFSRGPGTTPYCTQCKKGYMRSPQLTNGTVGDPINEVYSTVDGFDPHRTDGDKEDIPPPPLPLALQDRRAVCTTCPSGEYTNDLGQTECWECPKVGLECRGDGTMHVKKDFWFKGRLADPDAREQDGALLDVAVDQDTDFKACDPGNCVEGGNGLVSVTCKEGHKGALCGGCDWDPSTGARYVVSGKSCAQCDEEWLVYVMLSAIALAIVAVLTYVLALHNLDIKVGDHSIVYQKLLLSNLQVRVYTCKHCMPALLQCVLYLDLASSSHSREPLDLQMMGALGMMKARGTDFFNEVFSRPANQASGSISSVQFLKCVSGSNVYQPFVITMAAPIVLATVAAFIMIPINAIENQIRKRRRLKPIGDAPTRKVPFVQKYWKGVLQYEKLLGPCAKSEMTEEDKADWKRLEKADRKRYIADVRLRQVYVFIIFALYPTLVSSVMTIFNCEEIQGTSYLVADLTRECWVYRDADDQHHVFFVVMASIFTVIYCIGIPFAIMVLLLSKLEEVYDTDDEMQRNGPDKVASLRGSVRLAGGLGDAADAPKKCAGFCQPVRLMEDSESEAEEESSSSGSVSLSSSDDESVDVDKFAVWRKRQEKKRSKTVRRERARARDSILRVCEQSAAARTAASGPAEDSGEDGDEDYDEGVHVSPMWTRRYSSEHSAPYWEHRVTGESQWVKPEELGPDTDNSVSQDNDGYSSSGDDGDEGVWTQMFSAEHGAPFWQHTGITEGTGTMLSVWTEPTRAETKAQNKIVRNRGRVTIAMKLKAGIAATRAFGQGLPGIELDALGEKAREELERKAFQDAQEKKEAKAYRQERRRQRDAWYFIDEFDDQQYGPHSRLEIREWYSALRCTFYLLSRDLGCCNVALRRCRCRCRCRCHLKAFAGALSCLRSTGPVTGSQ